MRYFFCLRIHAPHARDVLAQSYVILPREVKRVRVQRIREVYPRCIAARTEANMFGYVVGIGPRERKR